MYVRQALMADEEDDLLDNDDVFDDDIGELVPRPVTPALASLMPRTAAAAIEQNRIRMREEQLRQKSPSRWVIYFFTILLLCYYIIT